MSKKKITVGSRVSVPAGTSILFPTTGNRFKKIRDSVVTVREMTTKMSGVVTISWKCCGLKASTSFKP